MTYYTMDDIRRINKEKGFYFFSPDTMRFFRSRAGDTVYQGNGGIFFTTSEQFDYDTPRYYTVRKFNPDTGNIKTVGDFNELSYSQARSRAKYYAEVGINEND